MKETLICRYNIRGSLRISNIIWTNLIFFGSLYFLNLSYSSYLLIDLISIDNSVNEIVFFPQGFVLGIYSILGLFYSLYSFLTIFLKLGYGFNEFNKKEKIIRIFRWGFPGKNRRIQNCYSLNDLKSVKIVSNKTISICLKGDSEIILIREGFIDSIILLENQATDIADFLGVPLIYSS